MVKAGAGGGERMPYATPDRRSRTYPSREGVFDGGRVALKRLLG
jgi:hypothetical protein